LCLISIFFFQAEDGIRDGHVTGVQTCALPICRRRRFLWRLSGAAGGKPAAHRSLAPGIVKAMEITMSMNIGENARMALSTLRENKMRSFLTVLGVVIGITALLSVVSILVGVYGDVNAYLSDYGS